MFQKAFEKIRDFLGSLNQPQTELTPGVVVDALSEESFPARADIAATIEPDLTPFYFGSAIGPAIVTAPPTWQLRIQTSEGGRVDMPLDQQQRQAVIDSLRDQVARDGFVSSIPLPNLAAWPQDDAAETR